MKGIAGKIKHKEKESQRVAFSLRALSLATFMVGLCYLSVPLYQLYCQTAGVGTIAPNRKGWFSSESQSATQSKQLSIYFQADTSSDLPWTFQPSLKHIKVYPGDSALTFYLAHNSSDEAISGISTYNVTPAKAGVHFNKIQCFCFEEQRLKARESLEMPVLFFIDSEFEKDPKMKDVDTITLSYTFYRTSEFALRNESRGLR